MVTYKVEYKKGFIYESYGKRRPKYFYPAEDDFTLAHDITDHLTHNPALDPIVDELVAIGATWFRQPNTATAYLTLLPMFQSTLDRVLVHESMEDVQKALTRIFKISYTMGAIPEVENLCSYAWGISENNKPHFKKWISPHKEVTFPVIVKALSKGFRLAEKYYLDSLNSERIYNSILNYAHNIKMKPVSERENISLKFEVSRRKGKVEAFLRLKDSGSREWYRL